MDGEGGGRVSLQAPPRKIYASHVATRPHLWGIIYPPPTVKYFYPTLTLGKELPPTFKYLYLTTSLRKSMRPTMQLLIFGGIYLSTQPQHILNLIPHRHFVFILILIRATPIMPLLRAKTSSLALTWVDLSWLLLSCNEKPDRSEWKDAGGWQEREDSDLLARGQEKFSPPLQPLSTFCPPFLIQRSLLISFGRKGKVTSTHSGCKA